MNTTDKKALADRMLAAGVAATLRALGDEIAAIEKAFPDLRVDPVVRTDNRQRGDNHWTRRQKPKPVAAKKRARRPMTKAEKLVVSKRMKAYWAKRRGGK